VKVAVYKVDREEVRVHAFQIELFDEKNPLESLKPLMNVGDMVRLPDGTLYKRVRGGFEKASREDEALLLAALMTDNV